MSIRAVIDIRPADRRLDYALMSEYAESARANAEVPAKSIELW